MGGAGEPYGDAIPLGLEIVANHELAASPS
jgi:hypothetical protein